MKHDVHEPEFTTNHVHAIDTAKALFIMKLKIYCRLYPCDAVNLIRIIVSRIEMLMKHEKERKYGDQYNEGKQWAIKTRPEDGITNRKCR